MTHRESNLALAIEPTVNRTVLARELETDWAPDPWSWGYCLDLRSFDGAYEAATLEFPLWLDVPFPMGSRRRVPLLGPWTRAIHTSVAHLLATHEDGSLREGVYGFRTDGQGMLEHYRSALARRRTYERELVANHDFVLTADVREFFRSITEATLAETVLSQLSGPIRSAATAVTQLVSAHVGYPIPEGYNASRSIASLVMRPVDASIDLPFSRWIDDYKIFSSGPSTLEEASDSLAAAARGIDLELNPAKSRISRSFQLDTSYVGSLDCAVHDVKAIGGLAEAMSSDRPNEKRIRFLVRLATEHSDDSALETLGQNLANVPDIAMPRIAWLIGSQPDHPSTPNIVEALLDSESDYAEWRFLRLAYAMWYLPTSAVTKLIPQMLPAAVRWPSTRSIIGRVLARHAPNALRSISLLEHIPSRDHELLLKEMNGHEMPGPPIRSYL